MSSSKSKSVNGKVVISRYLGIRIIAVIFVALATTAYVWFYLGSNPSNTVDFNKIEREF